jgi:hypothetical protein
MLGNRFLILLGGCFLTASAAWADDVGFVDCSNHSDEIQVFAKARKSPEVVASVACGERFTILVYGFVFSRIQTKDGNVGYIYSNVVSVDRTLASVQRSASPQMSEAKLKVPIPNSPVARPGPAASVKPQPTTAEPAVTTAPSPALAPDASKDPQTVATVAKPAQDLLAQTESAPVAQPTEQTTETAEIVMHNAPAAPAQPEPSIAAQPVSSRAPSTGTASASTTVASSPSPATPARPEHVSAEPAAPSIRPGDTRTTWEKPLPSARNAPLIELFGGASFARMAGGGAGSNLIGALGSFGWNFKPWLQIVGDSSYNTVTYSGTKNVLYGNHYGPRYFYRTRNRWHLTPFAEGLVGMSRSDSTITGTGGYTTSVNGMSFKFGGGVDYRPSRRLEIRLFDVDYYRTSFGANVYQTNYWISSGIVIRLFGSNSD